jgi:hypothetical protein
MIGARTRDHARDTRPARVSPAVGAAFVGVGVSPGWGCGHGSIRYSLLETAAVDWGIRNNANGAANAHTLHHSRRRAAAPPTMYIRCWSYAAALRRDSSRPHMTCTYTAESDHISISGPRHDLSRLGEVSRDASARTGYSNR